MIETLEKQSLLKPAKNTVKYTRCGTTSKYDSYLQRRADAGCSLLFGALAQELARNATFLHSDARI
jgi:hypothetical protein